MPYTRNWGTGQPGCLIFLLDQSSSMDDPFGGSSAEGGGGRKCDVVANVLNEVLQNLILRNTAGTEVRNRADIAVIGYHGARAVNALAGPLANKPFVTLSELNKSPIDRIVVGREVEDDDGVVIENIEYPVWVRPVAEGLTPMCSALGIARELAGRWAKEHHTSYPPVIVNVTDGESKDGDPRAPAQRITNEISTEDGAALLFNCHITEHRATPVVFPGSAAAVPNDPYARLLFDVSSPVPDRARQLYQSVSGEKLEPGSRGFIFNGGAIAIHTFFNFATVAALPLLSEGSDRQEDR